MFHAAFLPQFIDPNGPVGPQMALLSVTYLVIATVLDAGYVLLAGRLRGWLRDRRRARLRNRLTGSLLIATGLGKAIEEVGKL
jgi:homoserine/homoserine lactone efflux protein